jgi:tetratricopeptide (TPR) repeat protein
VSEQFEELMQQAMHARRENRFANAKRDYARAVDICRQNGNKADLARALKGLGQIERDLGHLEIALQHYEEALALHRAEGGAFKIAHTVRHVGDIHQDAGSIESAEPCYNEALKLYRAHKQTDALDLANTIRGMALLKEKTGNHVEAKLLWEEARDLYSKTSVSTGVAESTRHLALLA